ncbi:MAG: metallophosphoesterase [Acidimicrobiia bacterium]|nr:metallophosphoesterase [Acidimicrobiia bacterium]NND14446.1 hypothetical protein [Acidimicrobiia bacterium]
MVERYDVIGDVHGCLHTLKALMKKLGYKKNGKHPAGRKLVFVGDVINRGNHSTETLAFIRDLVENDLALMVRGNHESDWSKRVLSTKKASKDAVKIAKWLHDLPYQLLLDDNRLMIVHAAAHTDLVGVMSNKAERWSVRGGRIRGKAWDWQNAYRGKPFVVAGHTPVAKPRFSKKGGGSVIIDTSASRRKAKDRFTGKKFAGYLTAFRWPEKEIVKQKTLAKDL